MSACLSRRAFVGLLPLLAGCAGADPDLSPASEADVARVQSWFDGLGLLRARFVEIDANGAVAGGTVLFAPPGRLRLDYGPGDRRVVIASNGRIVAVDRSDGAVTRLPARSTPLGLLLDGPVRLRGDGIAVVQVVPLRPGLQVSLAPARNRGAGLLTIVFGEDASARLVLASIAAIDDQRQRTVFRFDEVRTGVTPPAGAFDAAALVASAAGGA